MKLKSFLIAFGTFVTVTGLLYLIGYTFQITLLIFHHQHNQTAEGFTSESRSLLPFIIGLGASYIAEKIYLSKKYDFSNKN
jgi:hypothetical protein